MRWLRFTRFFAVILGVVRPVSAALPCLDGPAHLCDELPCLGPAQAHAHEEPTSHEDSGEHLPTAHCHHHACQLSLIPELSQALTLIPSTGALATVHPQWKPRHPEREVLRPPTSA